MFRLLRKAVKYFRVEANKERYWWNKRKLIEVYLYWQAYSVWLSKSLNLCEANIACSGQYNHQCNQSFNCFYQISLLLLIELCYVSPTYSHSTTSNAPALLVLSLTFDFSSTKHQVHFRDASFFSKKHLLVLSITMKYYATTVFVFPNKRKYTAVVK